MRIVRVDGSPAAVGALAAAVAGALDGGPAVLPLAAGAPVPAALGGARVEPGNVLVATSGSTGEPRLVVLSAAALRASATATEGRLGGPARWLLALPADHVAGLQVIVRALLAGAARGAPSGVPAGPAAVDLRPGFRPAAFAAAAAALGDGPRCTSLVPTQLRRLLDDGGAPLDALRACTAVLVGGAALDPGLRARAEAAGVRVVTTYGMTETAGGCVYDGVPLDGVRVHLDGDGRITLGGPTLAAGYLGHPPDPAPAPDAGLGGAASGAAGPGAAGRGAAGSGP
ncbi:MAG TPA: AMP-binding protein, partial [Pseudonocardia sp.]